MPREEEVVILLYEYTAKRSWYLSFLLLNPLLVNENRRYCQLCKCTCNSLMRFQRRFTDLENLKNLGHILPSGVGNSESLEISGILYHWFINLTSQEG